jgi:hypothetical protein
LVEELEVLVIPGELVEVVVVDLAGKIILQ